VSRYQKGKTNFDFTEARDSKWQWHQLGHVQVCTALQTTMPAPHHSVFTGQMPFLPPNQQRQSTGGKGSKLDQRQRKQMDSQTGPIALRSGQCDRNDRQTTGRLCIMSAIGAVMLGADEPHN